jgi:hypothetical protein
MTKPVDLEIDEVTTCPSLSMSTLSIAKRIAPVNFGINLEKCEYPHQVKKIIKKCMVI